jgi:phosphoadenosine phosphosulfate reductase
MLTEIQQAAEGRNCAPLLEYLIADRFKGETIVTASLRARSVVVLQMIADINPATPIVFCHAGTLFPESLEYKKFVIERFAFTDIREPQMGEFESRPGDCDHVEWMKAHYNGSHNFVKEALHLNKTLAGFECWISAVYHVPPSAKPRNRIDMEGKLIRVNPVHDWSKEAVAEFMEVHELPRHKLARHDADYPDEPDGGLTPSYAY